MAKSARAVLVGDLDDLLAASRALRQELLEAEKSYRRAKRLVAQGRPMDELLSEVGARTVRSKVSEALDAFEKARHVSRRSFVVTGQSEGMSLGKMGKLCGFSRQLAARYAAESRAAARQASPRRPGRSPHPRPRSARGLS